MTITMILKTVKMTILKKMMVVVVMMTRLLTMMPTKVRGSGGSHGARMDRQRGSGGCVQCLWSRLGMEEENEEMEGVKPNETAMMKMKWKWSCS